MYVCYVFIYIYTHVIVVCYMFNQPVETSIIPTKP